MRLRWRAGGTGQTLWAAAFFSGFAGGIAAVCAFSGLLVQNPGFLDLSFFSHVKQLDIDRNSLLFFSVRQRFGNLILLVLLSLSGLGGVGSLLFLIWSGVSAGIILTALSMRYGLGGILLFAGSVLPQQVFLVPGFLFLLEWCRHRKGIKKLWAAVLLLLFGCLMETYVNPLLMRFVFNFI